MHPITCLLTLTLACTAAAQNQNPIQWLVNAQEGVQIAKRTLRPVLFWVPPSRDDEGSELKDAQDQSFRDPLVREIVYRGFVPIRLPRNNENMNMLGQMGAPTAYGMYLAVVTPEGKLVGVIQPFQTAAPQTLVPQLVDLFRAYRRDLFERELKPVLEKTSAPTAEVERALRIIRGFRIPEADAAVGNLLGRSQVSDAVKRDACATLATLSTPTAVKTLLDAAEGEPAAADALDHCTPVGAVALAAELKPDGGERSVLAYEAIARIDRVWNRKYKDFWKEAPEAERVAEVERITKTAQEAAKRWRDEGGELREIRLPR